MPALLVLELDEFADVLRLKLKLSLLIGSISLRCLFMFGIRIFERKWRLLVVFVTGMKLAALLSWQPIQI